MVELREKIAREIARHVYEGRPEGTIHGTRPAADAILDIPELRAALSHYGAAQVAFEEFGQFTITKDTFLGRSSP